MLDCVHSNVYKSHKVREMPLDETPNPQTVPPLAGFFVADWWGYAMHCDVDLTQGPETETKVVAAVQVAIFLQQCKGQN